MRVFSIEGVDATRTTSNHIIEILQVLGIEAARNSLVKELRMILGTYDIYVNYRHLSTLVDVMTQRGIFTAITRHGINRVDSGPLRKCSFEETAEILLEAAFFGEHDTLTGITENIIFGQLAPYGTGSVDLIVDQKALLSCLDTEDKDPYDHLISPEPVGTSGEPTPLGADTPGPHQSEWGRQSIRHSIYEASAFTPKINHGQASPSASSVYSPNY